MPRPASNTQTKVTFVEDRGIYKAMIGGKVFYFGSDRRQASAEASSIRSLWREHKAAWGNQWPSGQPDRNTIKLALGIAIPPSPIALSKPTPPQPKPETQVPLPGVTLGEASDLYLSEIKAKVNKRWMRDVVQRLGVVVATIGPETQLRSINQQSLVKFRDHWAALPFKRNKAGKTSTTERVSHVYAKHIVTTAKSFFRWAADHQVIEWPAPKGLDGLFSFRAEKSKSHAELTAFDPEEKHFELSQLQVLLGHADARMRAYILLALNCGYYPEDLSDLRAEHIVKEGAKTYIRNKRKKTGVKRSHLLWKETAEALETARDNRGKEGLVFLTPKGESIRTTTYNTLDKPWGALRKEAGLNGMMFKHLRHTSSHLVKTVSDSETSAVHRANKGSIPMDAVYNSPVFTKLEEALQKVYLKLKEAKII